MPPDYTGWPSKRQAAEEIGVSTKWLEQLEAGGRLEAGLYKRPGGGNRIKVYNPGDVAALAAARRTEAAAFVVPPGPGDAVGARLLDNPPSPRPSADGAQLVQLLEWFRQLLELAGSGKLLGTAITTRYVDLDEAARLKNLTVQTLRRAIRTGELEARKDPPRGGVWKVRLDHLEGL